MEEIINLIGQVMQMITKGPYTNKVIFNYLTDIVLMTDEIIHGGYVVCMDAQKVFERIRMKDQNSSSPAKPAQQAEQQSVTGRTFSSLFGFAKNTLNKTLNLG
jgi:hypothetical protein